MRAKLIIAGGMLVMGLSMAISGMARGDGCNDDNPKCRKVKEEYPRGKNEDVGSWISRVKDGETTKDINKRQGKLEKDEREAKPDGHDDGKAKTPAKPDDPHKS